MGNSPAGCDYVDVEWDTSDVDVLRREAIEVGTVFLTPGKVRAAPATSASR